MKRIRPVLTSSSSRRSFLRAVGVGSVSLAALASCGPTQTALNGGGGGDEDGGDGDGGVDGDGDGDSGTLEPTCGELTEPNIEGPFFSEGSPERTSLREEGMAGVLFVVEGRVRSTDCEPILGAVLDFWQADDGGAYDNAGFELRGHQSVDGEGAYVLETIVPGHYLNGASYRPAHIHVTVKAPGFRSLTTQLYFAGDPYNGSDPFIRQSLIMDWVEGQTGEREATFDFVLARA